MLWRLGLVAVVLVGCGQTSRISECQRFVGVANPALKELQALDQPNHVVPDSAAYDRLANRFDALVAQIDGLGLKDGALVEAVGGVRTAMKTAGDDCREYARELREHDRLDGETQRAMQLNVRRKLKKTRTRVAQNQRSYKAQVGRVNAVCQPQ